MSLYQYCDHWKFCYNRFSKANMNPSTKHSLFFLIFIKLVSSQANSSLGLGPNLVGNSDFENPALAIPSVFQQYTYTIPSWNCKLFCKVLYIPIYCTFYAMSCSISPNQVFDLDSNNNQAINQTVSLPSAGLYQLSFQWSPPIVNGLGRYLEVYIDQILITNITINPLNNVTNYPNNFSSSINTSATSALIQFKMGGTPNGYGYMIDNIALQQVLQASNPANSSNTTNPSNSNSSNQNNTVTSSNNTYNTANSSNSNSSNQNSTVTPSNNTENSQNQSTQAQMSSPVVMAKFLLLNNLQQKTNSVPGGRIFFSALLSFLSNFDRLQLYYYHNQTLTKNSQDFLQMINQLQLQKGTFIQNILRIFESNNSANPDSLPSQIINFQNSTLSNLNYKQVYSDPYIQHLSQQGSFFYANNFDFFYYSILGTLIFHLLFYLAFRLLFNYRISVFFRKYCFFAMIYFQFFAGNSEQFTFYYFQELKALFSFKYSQKLQTSLLILFYFLLFIFSFAGILLLKFWYKKNVKYFIQKPKKQLLSLLFLTFEVGIIPITFGAVHSLLIHNLFVQTVVLMALQASFSLFYLYFLVENIFHLKTVTFLRMIAGFLRILFNAIFYVGNKCNQQEVINDIVSWLILSYIIVSVLQMIIQLYVCLAELFMVIKFLKMPKLSQVNHRQGDNIQLKMKVRFKQNGLPKKFFSYLFSSNKPKLTKVNKPKNICIITLQSVQQLKKPINQRTPNSVKTSAIVLKGSEKNKQRRRFKLAKIDPIIERQEDNDQDKVQQIQFKMP